MRHCLRIAVLALLVVAPACAIHLDDHGPDMLDEAIRSAAAEVNLHHAMMTSAQTMDDVRAEVARHDGAMDDRLREMHRRMNDWGCVDYGGMHAMDGMLDEVEAREAAYATEVAAATTVTGARDVCAHYGDDMDVLFGRMMNRWTMMDCEYDW